MTVVSLTATTPTPRLSCPEALARFSGLIQLNHGGGIVRYQWLQLDGKSQPVIQVSLPPGQRTLSPPFQFPIAGNGSYTATAVLHVLNPSSVYSPPVTVQYGCP
jgi:hypothetical protein